MAQALDQRCPAASNTGSGCSRSVNADVTCASASNGWLRRYHFFAIVRPMKTTIDSAGRIVVPKSLRQALNIKPGQSLDIRAGDGRLVIEITATPMTLKKRGKDVVAVPDIGLPTLTADAVRETLEHIRR